MRVRAKVRSHYFVRIYLFTTPMCMIYNSKMVVSIK
jgi:hypothetical protein